MMRLINADSLKELYEGFGEYEDSLVVPIAVILQNIDDMPTIAMINESILSKSLKEEKFAPVTWGDEYAPDGSEIIDMWECPGCERYFDIESEHYDYCPYFGQHIDWSSIDE